MNVLVVGAGAVGATYARALKKGGARLTFLVREKYVDEVKRGIRIYLLARGGAKEEMLVADEVLAHVGDLASRSFDQVWLCVPTTGVDDRWLAELAQKTGDALIVDLTPDLQRRALAAIGRDRLVEGMIPVIAYQTPLKGTREEGRAPGIAIWLPPFFATPLCGPRACLARDALVRGGMRAREVREVANRRAFGGALLNTFIAQLEVAGWSLKGARERVDSSTSEAISIVARELGTSAGMFLLLSKPWVIKLGVALAPLFIPIPFEVYLRYHFTKVGPQTRAMMRTVLELAHKHKVEARQLQALATALYNPAGCAPN